AGEDKRTGDWVGEEWAGGDQSAKPLIENAGDSRETMVDSIKIFHVLHAILATEVVILILLRALTTMSRAPRRA
ncbi:MAG: hypothetical protein ABI680_04415, partial [Chthoniobacteraceae bacterium]